MSTIGASQLKRKSSALLDGRNTERLALTCSLQYTGEVPSQPHAGQGITKDLSISGCKVITDRPVTRGTLLTLTIAIPDGDLPLSLTAAHVVWVSGCQFSVRFLQLSLEQRRRLQTYIWKHISHTTVHNQRPRFRLAGI